MRWGPFLTVDGGQGRSSILPLNARHFYWTGKMKILMALTFGSELVGEAGRLTDRDKAREGGGGGRAPRRAQRDVIDAVTRQPSH